MHSSRPPPLLSAAAPVPDFVVVPSLKELGRRQASSAEAGDAVSELRGAREDVKHLLKDKSCHPILVSFVHTTLVGYPVFKFQQRNARIGRASDYLLGTQEILNITTLHHYVVKGLSLLYYVVMGAHLSATCLSHTQVLKLFLIFAVSAHYTARGFGFAWSNIDQCTAAYRCLFVTCVLNYFWFQVRLGWHDAGTYDKNISEWPQCGGANGSLRFEIELKHAANAGSASPPLSLFCFIQRGVFLN